MDDPYNYVEESLMPDPAILEQHHKNDKIPDYRTGHSHEGPREFSKIVTGPNEKLIGGN